MPEFPVDGPIDAKIHVSSGSVRMTAEDRTTVEVSVQPEHNNEASRATAEATIVEMRGNLLYIEVPNTKGLGFIRRNQSLRISVRLPLDCTAEVVTASADVLMEGRFAAATVNTASGDLRAVEIAGDLDRRSASGDSEIGKVGGDLTMESASGDLRIKTVGGGLRVRSASGDVTVESVGASVKVNTASGDVRIGSIHVGETSINSASGDVRVGVAKGTAVWLDVNTLSGDTRSELSTTDGVEPAENPATLRLSIHTMSGDVLIQRAPRAQNAASEPVGLTADD